VVGCGALALYPAATSERFGELVAVPAVAGLCALAAAVLFAWPSGIAWALALLGTAYACSLAAADTDTVDAAAPLYAGGLLLVAELAYWSLELRGARHDEPGALLGRLVALTALASLSVAVGGFVVLVTAAPAGSGLAWDALGITAVAATLAIVARLARRGSRTS
jgi:hypothetical protein